MESKKKVDQLSSVGDPQKVKVLILTEQKTSYADFYFMAKFTNVVKLDLSYNKLSTFPIGFTFKSFHSLKTLFLHYNKFSALKPLNIIYQNQQIQYLTLFGNPLEETKTRHFFVNQMPSLKLMDDKVVLVEERSPHIIADQPQEIVKISFPIVTVLESQGSAYFLSAVISQLILIRKQYLKANPIIRIQRWYRKMRGKQLKLEQQMKIRNSPITEKLETPESQRIRKKDERERIITQKMEVNKSSEQKIASIFKMNFEFISTLKKQAKNVIYATKEFCEKQGIKFNELKGYYSLKIAKTRKQQGLEGKSYFQLIFKASQEYLIRKKGSNNWVFASSDSQKVKKMFTKYLHRHPTYRRTVQQSYINQQLSSKLEKLHQNYTNGLVEIAQDDQKKFVILKQAYFKSLRNQELFPLCLQTVSVRTSAAVSMQRIWRGYRCRKNGKNVLKQIKQKLSVSTISRWVRSLGLRHRSDYFRDVRSYLKKQNSEYIVVPSELLMDLQSHYQKKWLGINFIFRDQKIQPVIQKNSAKIKLFQTSPTIYPSYIQQLIEIQTDDNIEAYKSQNHSLSIFDLLFNGAKKVKYFRHNVSKGQKKQQKLVYLQYNDVKQARNRKFILSLVTFNFRTKQFTKCMSITPNMHIKDMVEEIKQSFMLIPHPEPEQNKIKQQFDILKGSGKFHSSLKLKLFMSNQDLSKKVEIFYPNSMGQPEHSLVRQRSGLKSIASSNNFNQQSQYQQSFKHSAIISKNQIKLYRQSPTQSHILNKYQSIIKKNNRYADVQEQKKQRQLEKCRSLQPSNSISPQKQTFPIYSHYNTEVDKERATLNLRQRLREMEIGRQIEKQSKKQKIQLLKESHRNKLDDNDRYRKKELNKIREKMLDQQMTINDKLQSQRLQHVLVTARRNKQIKMSLDQRQRNQSNSFQKEFIKRGNSSVRRQMQKFEAQKNIQNVQRSIDQYSLYGSQNSLSLHRKSNVHPSRRISNLKTDIKQFSIQVSESEADMSIGNLELQNFVEKQKTRKKKFYNKSKEINEESQRMQRQRVQQMREARKSSKKSKIVHSVFPQQFYPLQERSMGFKLPNINRK